MLSYRQWLIKKQKIDIEWYKTMIDDKSLYHKEYDRYKEKVRRFDSMVQQLDIQETARELVILGN